MFRKKRTETGIDRSAIDPSSKRRKFTRELTVKNERIDDDSLFALCPETLNKWQEVYQVCIQSNKSLLVPSSDHLSDRITLFLIANQELELIESCRVPINFCQLLLMTYEDMLSQKYNDTAAIIMISKALQKVLRISLECLEMTVDILDTLTAYWREIGNMEPDEALSYIHFEIIELLNTFCNSCIKFKTKDYTVYLALQKIQQDVSDMLDRALQFHDFSIQPHAVYKNSPSLLATCLHLLIEINNIIPNERAKTIPLLDHITQHILLDSVQGNSEIAVIETIATLEYLMIISMNDREVLLDFLHKRDNRLKDIFYHSVFSCFDESLEYGFSFEEQRGNIARLFKILFEIMAKGVLDTDLEGVPCTLMLSLLDIPLISKVPKDRPVLQCYMLEFLLKYMILLSNKQEETRYSPMIEANLLEILLEPALFDLPYTHISQHAESHLTSIIGMLLQAPSDSDAFIEQIGTSLEVHKQNISYIGKLNGLINNLIQERGSSIVKLFEKFKLIETVVKVLLSVVADRNEDATNMFKAILNTLLNSSDMARQLGSNTALFKKAIVEELFRKEEHYDFATKCMAKILRNECFSPMFSEYVKLIEITSDPNRLKSLLTGIQIMAEGDPLSVRQTQRELVENRIVYILYDKINQFPNSHMTSLILTALRYIMVGNKYCKDRMKTIGYDKLKSGLSKVRYNTNSIQDFESLFVDLFYMLFDTTSSYGISPTSTSTSDYENRDHVVRTPEIIPLILELLFFEIAQGEHMLSHLHKLSQIIANNVNCFYFAEKGSGLYILKSLVNETHPERVGILSNIFALLASHHITPHEISFIFENLETMKPSCFANVFKALTLAMDRSFIKMPGKMVLSPRAFYNFDDGFITLGTSSFVKDYSLLPSNIFTVALWVFVKSGGNQTLAEWSTVTGDSYFRLLINESGNIRVEYKGKSQKFTIQTEQRIDYKTWLLISLSMKAGKVLYNRKNDMSISINSMKCDLNMMGTAGLPKDNFLRFSLGGAKTHERLNGKMCNVYIFQAFLSSLELELIYNLGFNYELNFQPEGVHTYEYIHIDKSQLKDLCAKRFFVWSPRRKSPLIVPPMPRQDMLTGSLEVLDCSQRFCGVKLPEAIGAVGGLHKLLTALEVAKRLGSECIKEILKLIGSIIGHPSHMTHYAIIEESFCEMLGLVLEGCPITEDCMIAVFDILQKLDWSLECQKKALQALLLDSTFWHNQDASLHYPLVMYLWQFIPPHFECVNKRILTLLHLLDRHWTDNGSQNNIKNLYEVRRSFMELMAQAFVIPRQKSSKGSSMHAVPLVSSADLSDLADAMLDSGEKENLEEILTLLNEFMSIKNPDEDDREDLLYSLLYILEHYKEDTYICSKLIKMIKIVAFSEYAFLNPRYLTLSNSQSVDDKYNKLADQYEQVISALDQCLHEVLDIYTYHALFDLFSDTLKTKVLKQTVCKVLDLITTRIPCSTMIEEILDELKSQFHRRSEFYIILNDRDNFPDWLIKAFTSVKNQSIIEKLEVFANEIFSSNICKRHGGSWKFRQFMLGLIEENHDLEFIMFILQGVLSRMTEPKPYETGYEFFLNVMDVAYIVEDMVHSEPQFLKYSHSFYNILSSLMDICNYYTLLSCTWPGLPKISTEVLSHILNERPQLRNQEFVLQREGGLMRVLIKLILQYFYETSDDNAERAFGLLINVLKEMDSKSSSLIITNLSRKSQLDKRFKDAKIEKYTSVFQNFPNRDEDILYDDHFLAIFLMAECTELLRDLQSEVKRSVILSFIKKLIKECEIETKINLLSKETSLKEWTDMENLVREYKDEFYSAARTIKVSHGLDKKMKTRSRNDSFLGGASVYSESLQQELNSWKRDVRELTKKLKTSANNEEELRMNLMSDDWLSNVQVYLLATTSIKVNLVYRATCFYNLRVPSKQTSIRRDSSLMYSVKRSCDQRKQELRSWKKAQKRELVYSKLITIRKFRQLKRKYPHPDNSADIQEVYWKLNSRLDGLHRHNILSVNKDGSRHLDKVNKKYAKEADMAMRSPSRSLSMMVCDEDLETKKEALNSIAKFEENDNEEVVEEPELEIEQSEVLDSILTPEDFEDLASPLSHHSNDGRKTFKCERITVLGSIFGTLKVTRDYIIFKSSSKKPKPNTPEYFGSSLASSALNIDSEKIWEHKEIAEVLGRRFIHKYRAFEFYLNNGKSYFFNCFSKTDRQDFLKLMERYNVGKVYSGSLDRHFESKGYTKQWRSGEMSNFEYLMLLNKFGGRSCHDISQYPVFPWILSDYTSRTIDLNNPEVYRDLSKPIGAISEESREDAIRRFEQLKDEIAHSFHYGSHYSNGGIVSYFLIRLEPFATYAINLQGGYFDVADRLFSSISVAWEGSAIHSGDYKELIPEFFYLPDFLLNRNHYILGTKQDGGRVDDVELPEWAGGYGIYGAVNFIRIHRKALEGRIVSEKLPKWIDLVFGYKQKGKQAELEVNTYCHFTYEDSIKKIVGKQADPDFALQEGLIHQIVFYGQTPIQILLSAQAGKDSRSPQSAFDKSILAGSKLEAYEVKMTKLSSETIIAIFCTKRRLIFVNDSWKLIVCPWKQMQDSAVRFEYMNEYPLEGLYRDIKEKEAWLDSEHWNYLLESHYKDFNIYTLSQSNFTLLKETILVSGMHMDNSIKLHSLKGHLLRSLTHHCGVVTCLASTDDTLLSGSIDTSIALWKLKDEGVRHIPSKLLLGHSTGIIQVCASGAQKLVVSLDMSGLILLHDLRTGNITRCIEISESSRFVFRIAFSELGIIAAAMPNEQCIHLYYINGEKIKTEKTADEEVECIMFNSLGDCLVTGGNETITILNIFEDSEHRRYSTPVQTTVQSLALTPGDLQVLVSMKCGAVISLDFVTEALRQRTQDMKNILPFVPNLLEKSKK
jgi:hypothetical protein